MNKTSTTKLIEEWLAKSEFLSGRGQPFYISEVHASMIRCTALSHVKIRNLQTIILAMHHRGEIEKVAEMRYRKRLDKTPLICGKWGRTLTNEEIGIESYQFGVPV